MSVYRNPIGKLTCDRLLKGFYLLLEGKHNRLTEILVELQNIAQDIKIVLKKLQEQKAKKHVLLVITTLAVQLLVNLGIPCTVTPRWYSRTEG